MRSLSHFYKVVILFALTIFCTTCKKLNEPPDSLPPITQKGANTFACKIDGRVWTFFNKCDGNFFFATGDSYALEVSYMPFDTNHILPGLLDIDAERLESGIPSYFSVRCTIYKTGNIYDSIRGDDLMFEDEEGGSFGGVWYDHRAPTGSFEITKLDTVRRIISGTFAFNFYSLSEPSGAIADTIPITDGRFDLQLKNFNICSK